MDLMPIIANNCANEQFLNTNCATEGALFCGFVPERVCIWAQILCVFKDVELVERSLKVGKGSTINDPGWGRRKLKKDFFPRNCLREIF